MFVFLKNHDIHILYITAAEVELKEQDRRTTSGIWQLISFFGFLMWHYFKAHLETATFYPQPERESVIECVFRQKNQWAKKFIRWFYVVKRVMDTAVT